MATRVFPVVACHLQCTNANHAATTTMAAITIPSRDLLRLSWDIEYTSVSIMIADATESGHSQYPVRAIDIFLEYFFN